MAASSAESEELPGPWNDFEIALTMLRELDARSDHEALDRPRPASPEHSRPLCLTGPPVSSASCTEHLEGVPFRLDRPRIPSRRERHRCRQAGSLPSPTEIATAGITDRRGFLAALHAELPAALRDLQQGNVAPVDMAQAAIGPGMAVFSRYAKVIEPTGEPMPVRSALVLINQVLDEVLAEQEGEFDSDTRFAIKWFEQYGFDEAGYDPAEGLARATNVPVNGLQEAGILVARSGRVRLLRRSELSDEWDPASDSRVPVWEVAQQLVKRVWDQGSEGQAAELVRKVGGLADAERDLAYRLYSICERRGWADDALGFNALVTAWPEIARQAASPRAVQQELAP
jgi:hypothetical protein